MNRVGMIWMRFLVVVSAMPALAIGQTPPPGDDGAAEPFVDKSFGYAIRPPVGYTPLPHKQLLPNGQIQLVAFVSEETGSVLAVRHAKADQPIKKEQLLEAVVAEARAGHPNAEVIDQSSRTIGELPGATCAIKFVVNEREQLRQQAVILAKANEVFIIAFDTIANDHESFKTIFREILDSFEIIHSELSRKTIEQALERGIKLLADLKERDFTANLVPESYWRFDNKGDHVGFVRVYERQTARRGRPGIEIEEKAWFFTGQNSFKQLHNTIFLSRDMATELWENIMEVQAETPQGIAHTHQLLKAVRQRDKLALAYTQQAGDLALTNDALEVSSSYIPAVLIRIFPRLVDLETPQTYAFASYQTDTRTMVLRTFRVVGPDRPPGMNHPGPVYKIEDSEGMIPPINEVYVDKNGRILQINVGDMIMVATQWKEIEMLYKDKMDWADSLVQRANQQTIQQLQAAQARRNPAPTKSRSNR